MKNVLLGDGFLYNLKKIVVNILEKLLFAIYYYTHGLVLLLRVSIIFRKKNPSFPYA